MWRTAYTTDALTLCALTKYSRSSVVCRIVVDPDYSPMKGGMTNPPYAFI